MDPTRFLEHSSPPNPTPPARPAYMPPSWYASLWTWQKMAAYNQPLSFDTSKVTNMGSMFQVRSARAHATHSPVGSSLHGT